MAINIISSNLNQWGDKGNFETDPSTWGFGSDSYRSYARSSTYKTKNLYSCKATFLQGIAGTWEFAMCAAKGSAITSGKKYIAYAKVRTTAADVIGPDSMVISINSVAAPLSLTENSTTTVADIKSDFVQIWSKFTATADDSGPNLRVFLDNEDNANAGGLLYTDEFELYEYEEVSIDCTLEVDEANVALFDESAKDAADGQIVGAVTGANDPDSVQYSIDNETWQGSSLFSGLTAGGYTLYVREPDGDGGYCMDSYAVVINYTGSPVSIAIETEDESISGAGDGSITLTPSGGTVPYIYSNDNGVTSQTSNTFSGLSGGNYFIKVTDDTSAYKFAIATINTVSAAYQKVYFSKSPIPLILNATANSGEANYRVYIDVRVETSPGSGAYESKFIAAQEPDEDGKAIFNLRPAFRDVFSPAVPEGSTSALKKVTGIRRYYKVYYGDVYNDMTEPAELTATNPFLVMMGGISKRKWPEEDYFLDHLPAHKRFLTWMAPRKYIDRSVNDWLYFFNYDQDIYSIRAKAKAYYTDNTESLETLLGTSALAVEKGDIARVPSGTKNSGVVDIDAAKIIRYYDLWLVDQAGNTVSEVRRYMVEQYRNPDTRYILFRNSLGAFDLLRMTGRTGFTAEAERTTVEKYLGTDYDPEEGQYQVHNATLSKMNSYSTGYFEGKYARYMAKYMQELFVSPQVYDVTTGSAVPIIINRNSIQIQDADYRYFARFEAEDSFKDDVFTPDEWPEEI
jgi:hypothetical protein